MKGQWWLITLEKNPDFVWQIQAFIPAINLHRDPYSGLL